jgi:hypothetical protein
MSEIRQIRRLQRYQVYAVLARVEKLNRRAAKIGVEPLVATVGEYRKEDIFAMDGGPFYVTDVTVAGEEPVVPGGWTMYAAVEHLLGADDEQRNLVVTFREETEDALRTAAPDCDHCGHKKRRKKTYFVENDDGEVKQVGSTCVKDFLGHKGVEIAAWIDQASFDEDEEGWGASDKLGSFEIGEAVAYAILLADEFGYANASEGPKSTRDHVAMLLGDRGRKPDARRTGAENIRDLNRIVVRLLEKRGGWESLLAEADEAVGWLLALDDGNGRGVENEYLWNLQTAVATAEATPAADGRTLRVQVIKRLGFVVSLASAWSREKASRIKLEAWREADAERRETAEDAPTGRATVIGVVLKTDMKENDFGYRKVMTVLDDRGFKVWGTVPKAISEALKVGDRVQFTAALTPTERDATFAFFKSPSKATVLAEAAATAC